MTDDLLGLAEKVVASARSGEQVEAYVGRSHRTAVKVFEGDIESLTSADNSGIGVRVIAGRRQGFAYAGSLDPDMVDETLREARDNAAFGTIDEHLGLPQPDGVVPAALDLYRDDLGGVPVDRKVGLALEAERATRAADGRIRGLRTAAYEDSRAEGALASTEGIRSEWRRTVCSLYAYALATDDTTTPPGTRTGYGYSVARHPDDLDVAKVAGDAAERATRLIGATKPKSQRLTVFLDPRVTPALVSGLAAPLSADSVIKGRSLFDGQTGAAVASEVVTLVDDPTNPAAYGASERDAEGLACRRNVLIERGVLSDLLFDGYTARRWGRASNACAVRGGYKSTPGPGSRALTLAPGDRDHEQLLADYGEGLVVLSMTGLHSGVNTVSGDFSVGIEGVMVRGGATAEPVREATIASTIQQMLRGVEAVGSDVEWLPGGAAGMTLVIGDVTLSGC